MHFLGHWMCFRISAQLPLMLILCLAAESTIALFHLVLHGEEVEAMAELASSAGVGGGNTSRDGEIADRESRDPAAGASGDGESHGSGEKIVDSRAWEACMSPATWVCVHTHGCSHSPMFIDSADGQMV